MYHLTVLWIALVAVGYAIGWLHGRRHRGGSDAR